MSGRGKAYKQDWTRCLQLIISVAHEAMDTNQEETPYTICLRLQYSNSIGAVAQSTFQDMLTTLSTVSNSHDHVTNLTANH